MNYRNWTVAELLDMEGSGVSHGPAVLLQSEGEKGGSGEGRSPWLSGAAGEGCRRQCRIYYSKSLKSPLNLHANQHFHCFNPLSPILHRPLAGELWMAALTK